MKRRKSFFFMAALGLLTVGLTMVSCSTGDDGETMGAYETDGFYLMSIEKGDGGSVPGGGGSVPSGQPNAQSHAGVVTAGEWNDLSHWPFWSKLMADTAFLGYSSYWECYTNLRVPIEVTDDSGKPLANVPVQLVRVANGRQTVLWQAKTDNTGHADCWVSVWQKSTDANAASLRVSINGKVMDDQPVVSGWDEQAEPQVNTYRLNAGIPTVMPKADIAFVVDATGSMTDEINFLKSDLIDIISKVSALRPEQTLRTAALFYRDEGDEYLTVHSNFTADVRSTADFVDKQTANGGGDYPEAVHTALERMLQDLTWDDEAGTRLVFLVLDAPAHHKTDVIRSLQQSVGTCARMGIRLIPVAASGIDKNTEFMLRFYAILTGGTYVFLTNDSGVGNPHIEASVGDYKVELLNELIIRLIDQYLCK